MGRHALHATNEVHAGGQVAPLVAAAQLQRASVAAVQLQVIDRLHDLVAELGVADATGLEPGTDRLLGQHPADAEVLADVAQPIDGGHLGRPVEVVHDRRRIRPGEVEIALHLGSDSLDPCLDHLRVVQGPFAGSSTRIPHQTGRPADEADGPVARLLEAAHRHEQDEIAEVKAGGGRVEPAVERDRAVRQRRAQVVEVGVVGNHAPPLEVVEHGGAGRGRRHRRLSIESG